MPFTIAVTGKGGTGKTTISAFLVDSLVSRKAGTVLAVDADPNSNLGDLLGVKEGQSMVDIIDEVSASRREMPAGMTKERVLEYKLEEALSESQGFDVIAMGRGEGPGCYCYPNSLLREMIVRLGKKYDYVVVDNEAGMEHLSRRTMRAADILAIVSDFSVIGIRSAKRIWELVTELKIAYDKVFLVVNKSAGFAERLRMEMSGIPYDRIFYVPADNRVAKLSLMGRPVTGLNKSSRAAKALARFADEICKSSAGKVK